MSYLFRLIFVPMPETENNRKIYSLLEISRSISRMIQHTYPDAYWIKAEIAKLNYYPQSGHCYPDLVEKQQGVVQAQIRANLWAGNYGRINQKFVEVTGEPLKDGQKILFLAKISFHERYGLALNILDVEPAFTLGEMAREKQLTIEKLKRENLLDENKKRTLPLLPKRLAVISVETSKGYSDFRNILENNAEGYRFQLTLFPALLQGDGAVQSIRSQLSAIADRSHRFDAVVIIRGGGGDVGLNAYDHYHLAKAVAQCPLPVITGIGHSTNLTVVQMVAYANKITPTEAAHFFIRKFQDFEARTDEATEKLERLVQHKLIQEKQTFFQTARMFDVHTRNFLLHEETHWNYVIKNFEQACTRFLSRRQSHFYQTISQLQYFPVRRTKLEKEKLLNVEKLLQVYARQRIREEKVRIGNVEEQVNLLNPENILKKGYSISIVNGKLLQSADQAEKGVEMVTRLFDGEIKSIIK